MYVSLGEKRVILMHSSDLLRSTSSAVTPSFFFMHTLKKSVRLISSYSGNDDERFLGSPSCSVNCGTSTDWTRANSRIN